MIPPAPALPPQALAAAYQRAVALLNGGRTEEALQFATRLLAAAPGHPQVLNLTASAERALGRLADAEAHWRAAIAAQPGHINAYNNLGLLLADVGRTDEAAALFRCALDIRPEAATCINLANLLLGQGHTDEAGQLYGRALHLQPDNGDAHYNLGLLLQGQQHTEQAEASFRRAAELVPDFADAHFHLGLCLLERRAYAEAFAAFRQTVALRPDHVDAINILGNLWRETGKLAEAVTAYRQALALKPDMPNLLNNLGLALLDQGQLDEAGAIFRRAVALAPDYGHALAQAMICAAQNLDWSHLANDRQRLLALLAAGRDDIPPFLVLGIPTASGADHRRAGQLAIRRQLGPRQIAPASATASATAKAAGRTLRIGYLSPDFREHAVMLLLGGVLAAHDPARVEIHGFATGIGGKPDDPYRQRAIDACHAFHDLRFDTDRQAADRIAAAGIDILVDLGGHTAGSRPGIAAWRPAPVQAVWLGYPGTVGGDGLFDYLIGDPVVTPLDRAGDFSEAIAQLPHCYLPNDDQRPIGAPASRMAQSLPGSGLVFCCFNQAAKLNPETLDLWCRLLREVPDSVLWLAAPAADGQQRLRQAAAERGVDGTRLIFAARTPGFAEHLGRLQLADLALDSFPYTSHTTGCDALWAGVPLLTRIGDTFVSRVAASLLTAVGLPELVAGSDDEFVAIGRSLAMEPARLARLRQHLAGAGRNSHLFDTQGFARDLEALYQRMWQDHVRGVCQTLPARPTGNGHDPR
jgi:predicted O-linked N-acetylglucosamine transferase (SPINDLY family)